MATGTTTQTDYDITQEQIETSATILANILLDYVRSASGVPSMFENQYRKNVDAKMADYVEQESSVARGTE